MNERTTAYRTCPLCEATCGLEITLDHRSQCGDGHLEVLAHLRLESCRFASRVLRGRVGGAVLLWAGSEGNQGNNNGDAWHGASAISVLQVGLGVTGTRSIR